MAVNESMTIAKSSSGNMNGGRLYKMRTGIISRNDRIAARFSFSIREIIEIYSNIRIKKAPDMNSRASMTDRSFCILRTGIENKDIILNKTRHEYNLSGMSSGRYYIRIHNERNSLLENMVIE